MFRMNFDQKVVKIVEEHSLLHAHVSGRVCSLYSCYAYLIPTYIACFHAYAFVFFNSSGRMT